MRRPTVVLLAAACLIGLLNIAIEALPNAFAQAPAGAASSGSDTQGQSSSDVVLATAVNSASSEALVFVYDKREQVIACYATRKAGLELRGIRKIAWDVQNQEYPKPPDNDPTSVRNIRKEIEELQKKAASGKAPGK
jgi:hypothetical protein